MVKLRLKRTGRKFEAIYRIVAADARAPRDGRFIEEVGFYNPQTKEVRINAEMKAKWLLAGAVPSETVKALFKKYDQENPSAKAMVTKPAKKAPAKKTPARKATVKKAAVKKAATKPAAKKATTKPAAAKPAAKKA